MGLILDRIYRIYRIEMEYTSKVCSISCSLQTLFFRWNTPLRTIHSDGTSQSCIGFYIAMGTMLIPGTVSHPAREASAGRIYPILSRREIVWTKTARY